MAETILSVSLKEYKTELDNLRASLAQMEKGSAEYEKTAQEIRDKQNALNDAMKVGKEATTAAAGSYNALTQEMSRLRAEWKATNDEATRNELGVQINNINDQLKALDETTGNYQRNVGNYAIAGESMKSQLKGMQEEMANMLASGIKPTDAAFVELAKKAGNMKDALSDAKGIVKQFADDAKGMSTAIDLAKTGTAVFGAYQGAMAAFGSENEELAKTMAKLQGIMTTLQSLQQLQIALTDSESASYQFFHGILQSIGLVESSNNAVKEATITATATEGEITITETAAEEANALAKQANGAATLESKTATEANKVATEGQTIATNASTVATNLASGALKLLKLAIAATGIGALVVALGLLIANWDKVTSAIKGALGITLNYANASEDLQKSMDEENHEIDNQCKLMKSQGKSETEIIQYKLKEVQAQKKSVEAKINEIKAQVAQTRQSSIWYKAVHTAVVGVANIATGLLHPILIAIDAIFNTNWAGKFEQMVNKVAGSVADFASGVSGAESEIEKLEEMDKKLDTKINDTKIELQVAQNNALNEQRKQSAKAAAAAAKDREKQLKEQQKKDEERRKEAEKLAKEERERERAAREKTFSEILANYDEQIQRQTNLNSLGEKELDFQQRLKEALGQENQLDKENKTVDKLKLQIANIKKIINLYAEKDKELKEGWEVEKKELETLKSKKKLTEVEKERLDELTKKEKTITETRKKYQEQYNANIQKLNETTNNLIVEEAKITTNRLVEENKKRVEEIKKEYEEQVDDINLKLREIKAGITPVFNMNGVPEEAKLKVQKVISDEMKDIQKEFGVDSPSFQMNFSGNFDDLLNQVSATYAQMKDEGTTYWQDMNQKNKQGRDEELETDMMYYQLLDGRMQESYAMQIAEYDEEIRKAKEANNPAEMQRLVDEQNKLEEEAAKSHADYLIQQLERVNKKKTEDKKFHKEWVKQNIKGTLDMANAFGDLFGGISDLMEANIDQKVKNKEISDEEAEEEFKRVKKVQIAQLWVNTLAGAAGAFLQDMQNYPAPYNYILAAVDFSTAMATGFAQMKSIQNTDYSGSGSSSSSSGGISSVSVSPLLNETTDYQQMTALNTSDIATNNTNQRIYILQSDINKSNKQTEVRQQNTTF